MFIPIHIREEWRPVGWSATNCPHCGDLEVAMLIQQVEEVGVAFVPITQMKSGIVARCYFCERFVPRVVTPTGISLQAWDPTQGAEALFDMLGAPLEVRPSDGNSDTRLNSLLSSLRASSGLRSEMDRKTVTQLAVGGIAGCVLMVPLALQFDFTIGGVICTFGAVVGAVVGALLSWQASRRRHAVGRLADTVALYRLDTQRLADLAVAHGRLVSKAARVVRDASIA
jgi:hypothetical protein